MLINNLPLLMLRPEDMVGSGDVKPYWPQSHLRDAIDAVGQIVSAPASWVCEHWPQLPAVLVVPLFVLTSCLWGFALALIVRLRRMHTESVVRTLLFTAILMVQPQLFAQEKSRQTLPDDPAKAWAEVEGVHEALRPPDDWRSRCQP